VAVAAKRLNHPEKIPVGSLKEAYNIILHIFILT